MTLQVRPTAITIANWTGRTVTIFLVLASGGVAVGAAFGRPDWPRWAKQASISVSAVHAYLALAVFALVWMLYRGCRLGARLDGEGVTIRKLLRTYRFSWPEVSHLEGRPRLAGKGETGWILAVVLRDARVVTTRFAFERANPTTLTAIRLTAERYGIPANMNGPAVTRGSPADAEPYAGPGSQPDTGYWEAIPPLSAGQQTWRRHLHPAAVILVGLGFTAYLVIGFMAATPPRTPHLTVEQLQPGDCLRGSNLGLGTGGTWPDKVTAVPCTWKHLAEVFSTADIWPQSLAYPGDDAISGQAYTNCVVAFIAYDGIDPNTSTFSLTEIVPDSASWNGGNRSVVCLAYEPGMAVNYSIKGSRR